MAQELVILIFDYYSAVHLVVLNGEVDRLINEIQDVQQGLQRDEGSRLGLRLRAAGLIEPRSIVPCGLVISVDEGVD